MSTSKENRKIHQKLNMVSWKHTGQCNQYNQSIITGLSHLHARIHSFVVLFNFFQGNLEIDLQVRKKNKWKSNHLF